LLSKHQAISSSSILKRSESAKQRGAEIILISLSIKHQSIQIASVSGNGTTSSSVISRVGARQDKIINHLSGISSSGSAGSIICIVSFLNTRGISGISDLIANIVFILSNNS